MSDEPLREGMVDVSERGESDRRAVAEGLLVADPETLEAIRRNDLPKPDPLETARAAALLAIKDTPRLVPHCHPIRLTGAEIHFELSRDTVRLRCEVRVMDRTGPPMEALQGVTTALLTLYDMIKALCPSAHVENVRVLEKTGGRSGHWQAED